MKTNNISDLIVISSEIERIYDGLKYEWDKAGINLCQYVAPYKENMGLISDKIWLRDTECLRLKYECRIAESNFKLFIKLHSKEVKQIQKLQHEQRRMKYIK